MWNIYRCLHFLLHCEGIFPVFLACFLAEGKCPTRRFSCCLAPGRAFFPWQDFHLYFASQKVLLLLAKEALPIFFVQVRSGDTPEVEVLFPFKAGSLQRLVRVENECKKRTACRAHDIQLRLGRRPACVSQNHTFPNAILPRDYKQILIFGNAEDRYRVDSLKDKLTTFYKTGDGRQINDRLMTRGRNGGCNPLSRGSHHSPLPQLPPHPLPLFAIFPHFPPSSTKQPVYRLPFAMLLAKFWRQNCYAKRPGLSLVLLPIPRVTYAWFRKWIRDIRSVE